MSDTTVTTVAPQAAPPPPAANETVINTNTSQSPNPITNTAPDKPQAPLSRRDAIQRAFDRAEARSRGETPQAKDAKPQAQAKPAKAEQGHNNPPADTEAEPKINLRRRADPKDPPAEPQPRDRGRFAPRQAAEGQDGQAAPQGQQQQQQAKPRQLPDNAPYRDPPQRMSEAAKAAWADTPETVRGDIHRVQQEFSKAFQAYKGAADAYAPIARFDQMARQQGTTLERALTNYTNMEVKLRNDLIGGLDVIINNLGIKGANGQRITLRDVAYHVLSQTPEQLKQVQMGNAQQAAQSQIGQLHQEIRGLKETINALHNQQQFTYTRSQVDQFADSHPRFDELGPQIEQELKLGFDLETAYRRAELLNPKAATTAAQTRDTAPQTRTTEADKSVSGAPAGASPQTIRARKANEKPVGRREAIANAIKRVNGAL